MTNPNSRTITGAVLFTIEGDLIEVHCPDTEVPLGGSITFTLPINLEK